MLSKILSFEVGWFDREENSSGALCARLGSDASSGDYCRPCMHLDISMCRLTHCDLRISLLQILDVCVQVRTLVGDCLCVVLSIVTSLAVAWTISIVFAWRIAVVLIALQPITITCFCVQQVLLNRFAEVSVKGQLAASQVLATQWTSKLLSLFFSTIMFL